MENTNLNILCLAGHRIDTKPLKNIFSKDDKLKIITYHDYSKKIPNLNYDFPHTTLMTRGEVKDFCQVLKKSLEAQNLNINADTFIDLSFHGNVLNHKHIIEIDKNVICDTKDLVYCLNKMFGAEKFNVYSCHGGEASKDLLENVSTFNISNAKGICVSSHVEYNQNAWTYFDNEEQINSLKELQNLFKKFPDNKIPAIVRFSQDLLHDHEMSYYSEVTENDHIQYKSSNLFNLENIKSWLSSYNEDPNKFSLKSIIEDYIINERQKLTKAFEDSTQGDNSDQKEFISEALKNLENVSLTHDEYQHFVLGRLVYRCSVTDQEDVSQHKELFTNFIKLLDDQDINFKADLNNNPEDGIQSAKVFFKHISNYNKQHWFSDLLQDYLNNNPKDGGIAKAFFEFIFNFGKKHWFSDLSQDYLNNQDKDEGYETDQDSDSSLYAALHPEKFMAPDEITHENDVHIDGVDDDHGFSEEII